MKYYLDKAKRDFSRAVICWCGAVLLGLLSGRSAFEGAPLWAVICGCGAVFCWMGASVFAHDANINRRKAEWF